MSRDAQRIGALPFVPPSRVLIVTMGGRLFALDASSVQGVLTLGEANPPDAPIVQGVVYRGVDLIARLALGYESPDTNVHLVLMSEGDVRKSVQVSRVHGLMELQSSQVLPLPPQFTGLERQWYRGLILFQNSVVPILATQWMLDDIADMPSGVHGAGTPLVSPEYPVIKGGTC